MFKIPKHVLVGLFVLVTVVICLVLVCPTVVITSPITILSDDLPDNVDPLFVDISQNPRLYDGKIVQLTGYELWKYEMTSLWPTYESIESRELTSYLPIFVAIPSDSLLIKKFKNYSKKKIIITGRFSAKFPGNPTLYCGTLSHITRIDEVN